MYAAAPSRVWICEFSLSDLPQPGMSSATAAAASAFPRIVHDGTHRASSGRRFSARVAQLLGQRLHALDQPLILLEQGGLILLELTSAGYRGEDGDLVPVLDGRLEPV